MHKFYLVFLISVFAVASMFASAKNDVFYEISKGSVGKIKSWLKTKPDLTVRNALGMSVLHAAVLSGSSDMVAMLVRSGAVVNALDSKGQTALDSAVIMHNNKIAYQLVKFGGKVTSEGLACKLKSMYKSRAIKFFIVGWFFTPLFWIGSAFALGNASDVMVMHLA